MSPPWDEKAPLMSRTTCGGYRSPLRQVAGRVRTCPRQAAAPLSKSTLAPHHETAELLPGAIRREEPGSQPFQSLQHRPAPAAGEVGNVGFQRSNLITRGPLPCFD